MDPSFQLPLLCLQSASPCVFCCWLGALTMTPSLVDPPPPWVSSVSVMSVGNQGHVCLHLLHNMCLCDGLPTAVHCLACAWNKRGAGGSGIRICLSWPSCFPHPPSAPHPIVSKDVITGGVWTFGPRKASIAMPTDVCFCCVPHPGQLWLCRGPGFGI